MNDISLSEKIDNLSPAEMKETSIRTKQLLVISRWPVFLGVGCAWLIFFVLCPMCVANKVVLIIQGVGLLGILILIFGLGKMRQHFMLGSGFALHKRRIDNTLAIWQSQPQWVVVILSVCIVVVAGGALGVMSSEQAFRLSGTVFPEYFLQYFGMAILGILLLLMTTCSFYPDVTLRLWEFILLLVIITTGVINIIMHFNFLLWWHALFATAMIVIGLSFMRRWFVWRRSLKTLEGSVD